MQTFAPTPTFEEAKTDEATVARRDERKRLKQAMNTRTTMLGGGLDSSGRKTLLGV
ncbi:MAG: hypothetical protein IJ705_08150 [Oscillospiraceae bacterium]|nr:hypothetical protein [Oscillospiraceae bacterium]